MADEIVTTEPEEQEPQKGESLLIAAERVYQWLVRIMEKEVASQLSRATPPREEPPKTNKF